MRKSTIDLDRTQSIFRATMFRVSVAMEKADSWSPISVILRERDPMWIIRVVNRSILDRFGPLLDDPSEIPEGEPTGRALMDQVVAGVLEDLILANSWHPDE